MPDDLYHRDILAWSRAQAERLRRLAAGEQVNDVDWANVIEEIEAVGRSEVSAVRSWLLLAFVHALKIQAWPGHSAARKWRNEAAAFLGQAQDRFQPAMAQAIDPAELLRRARKTVLDLDMRRPPAPLPEATDLTMAEIMAEEFGADALIARLRG